MQATWCYKCDQCYRGAEGPGGEYPECCGLKMRRDYTSEMFGGILHRNKGRYPMDDEMQGVVHESYQAHEKWIKDNGLVRRETSKATRESAYRFKHRTEEARRRGSR